MAATTRLGLPELAVEDAVTARQRPKPERYGDTLFVVLPSAHLIDGGRIINIGSKVAERLPFPWGAT